jgi:lactoylglutathione lyase
VKIAHVAIWTRDIERLREFYETHFEAKAGSKYVNRARQFESYFLSFESGVRLEIMQMPSVVPRAETSGPPQGYAHLALSVGSEAEVDRLTRRLRDSGCPVLSYPRRTGDGCYESIIADPDGNPIEITV